MWRRILDIIDPPSTFSTPVVRHLMAVASCARYGLLDWIDEMLGVAWKLFLLLNIIPCYT